MFDDKGIKEIFPSIDQKTMTVNDWEVAYGFKSVYFEKGYIMGLYPMNLF